MAAKKDKIDYMLNTDSGVVHKRVNGLAQCKRQPKHIKTANEITRLSYDHACANCFAKGNA